MKKKMIIFMCENMYSFLLSFLFRDSEADCIYLLPGNFNNDYVLKLNELGIEVFQFHYNRNLEKVESYSDQFKIFKIYLAKKIKGYLSKYEKVVVYGQDHSHYSDIFWMDDLRNVPFILLEDGTANYVNIADYPFLCHVASLFKHEIFGTDDRIGEIILTGIKKIPDNIREKVRVIDLFDEISKKKNELISFFEVEVEIEKIGERHVCLLTENFSASGMMTEEEQVELYKKMLLKYDYDNVFIKPHPSDKIEYDKIFPGCIVINRSTPFELIYMLVGKNIQEIVLNEESSIVGKLLSSEMELYDIKGNRVG